MNQNPIIKALQDELAKEREPKAINYEEALSDEYMEETSPLEMVQTSYSAGHEAATAFWLPLIEKAVEMAEVYALENDPDFVDRCLDEAIEMRNKNPHSKEVFGNAIIGKKAREFLATLADASGDK